VAATTGEFEAGFALGSGGGTIPNTGSVGGGQTREHIVLARGLGVTQFIVAVNKLDAADPPWDKTRFEHIKSNVLAFLMENGFKQHRVQFVPVSGLTGVNVDTLSINNNNNNNNSKKKDGDDTAMEDGWKALRQWYKGPTLIEALNSFTPVKREFEKPLRYIVSDVSSEGKAVTVRGRIVQGFLKVGDRVVLLPVGDEVNVTRLEKGKASNESDSPYSYANANTTVDGNNESCNDSNNNNIRNDELDNYAFAGDTVECSFTGIDAARVSPGCVISHPQLSVRPHKAKKFEARVMIMDQLAVPIIRGSQVLFHMHSIDVPAVLSKLLTSKKRSENTPRNNPRVLSGGVEATVEMTLSEYLVLEEYSECKSLGRFVLRRGGETVAIGLIEKLIHRK